MQVILMIVNFILVVLGLVGFLWTMIGIPVGMVWLIVHLVSNKKGKKLDLKKWVLVTSGGIMVLVIIFVLYALFFMILAMFRINTYPLLVNGSLDYEFV